MSIPLEDDFNDVMGKALRATQLTPGILEFLSGVPEAEIEAVLEGRQDPEVVRRLAPLLGLEAGSLLRLMRGESSPRPQDLSGLAHFQVPFDDMTVNHYVIWQPERRQAVMFDTGANADEARAFLEREGLSLVALFLTHAHLDHVADIDKLRAAYPKARVLMSAYEACDGVERFQPGERFELAGFTINTAMVRGHSPGATVYTVSGLDQPVAMVGDCLFAGSMGGALISMDGALEGARRAIFSLPDATVLCPGHGPMTTVKEEKASNPFFPEFKV